jgi:ribonuclease HII
MVYIEAGVDEAGRGALVGSVIAAAVILDPLNPIDGLADSKILSEKKRIILDEHIRQRAIAWAIGEATNVEIDNLNILQASLLAMKRAVLALVIRPDKVLVDGNKTPELDDIPCISIVRGDATVAAISAASILAKVYRDDQMVTLHKSYPQYGFNKHKGYPTREHLKMLKEHGVINQYRKTYKPVANLLNNSLHKFNSSY